VSEENKALVRHLIKEVEKGNLDVVDEVLAPDFVDHDLLPDQVPDREGYKRGLSEDRAALSNFDITIEDQIAEGDKVVTRWAGTGTHEGTLMGMEPTGTRATTRGIGIDRFEDGKIVEAWTQWDTLTFMRDIGAIPAEAGAPAA
jgi:steroid delta-isomerase-like uncharacterized protein